MKIDGSGDRAGEHLGTLGHWDWGVKETKRGKT